MNYYSWLAQEAQLSDAALTVLAQAVDPTDQDQLIWDLFFPRENVDDFEINTISDVNWRPVADRREWNTRGRYIPIITPPTARVTGVPIESYFKIDEEELNKLLNRFRRNQQLFREEIGATVPRRTRMLTEANYRRIEVDAMTSWALGQITVKDPQSGATTTVGFQFDVSRYQVVSTAWTDPTVNAYDELLSWLEDAIAALGGPPEGIMLRLAQYKEIQADAPRGSDDIMLTRRQLLEQLEDDTGEAFEFLINERTVDIFTDGGTTTTAVKVWPTGVIAAIPPGQRVGRTAFAPVVRAGDAAEAAEDAGIDTNGMAAFTEVSNGGRELTVECQVNALTVPDETKVYVIDVVP
jgi:hypothetical protein